MLVELKIKNFILIDELSITFGKGLNILTGETGAGKSILIDALSGVLGEKMSTDMIRSGYDRAVLEGVFDISNLPQVKQILEQSGIDNEDDTLILRREIYSNGKGRCFANSVQIPLAKLKEIADYLVDIHGQNEHQNIVQVAKHRELLDNFGMLQPLVQNMSQLHKQLQEIKEKIGSLQIDEREKARRIDYLTHAIGEIEQANLQPNEEEALKNESNVLSNAEKLFNELNTVQELMQGDRGVVQSLKKMEMSLSHMAGFDPNLSGVLETVREAYYSLEDAYATLRDYARSIDFSPERINQVEERLALISSLKKKYGDTIQDILSYAQNAKRELSTITTTEEELDKLQQEYDVTLKQARDLALQLSEKRLEAAKKLEQMVTRELADLGMQGTVFRVSIKREISPDGEIEANNKKYILYPHGLDRVEFLLSANEGEELRQLRKVASGGEMSRIMLALKKCILDADIVDSLVFDEVDAGIGGKTAEVVGKKLKALAKQRQVLVITHLPQIAAMSDNHYMVQKKSVNARTTTLVEKLSPDEKVNEVARMLAGEVVTDLSVKHAKELIELASKQ
ncbi:MAG TPA: DNA repair protein RecN [Spirochaetota bacterium]|nr:DNA repair protein RecN [Spirochaetota bacterium]HPP50273.1 DNA repair protein RecN [Spirochaetota bacterium]